jgi:quinol monooxygenase YgiN
MPSVVAKIQVKEDKLAEALAFLKQLTKETLANEKGTLAYVFHQQKDDPTKFVAYEKYADDAAFKTHSANLASKGAQVAGILAGRPEIILLDEL